MSYFSSSYISQSVGSQNAMFAQNNYMAQQMAMGGMQQGMASPPPMAMPPPPTIMQAGFQGGRGAGMAGERMAGGLASFGTNVAAPLAVGGVSMLGAAGSMGMLGGGALGMAGKAASIMDPFGMAMGAGRMGFGAMGGGMAGMAAGIGAAALPVGLAYGAAQLGQSYGSAFTGGIQDQMGLNANLRQNFNFAGGTGSGGRGFNQGQMGMIGGVIQQELNRNVFTNAGEMNQLVSGGAQAGMFTGVRDVSQFAEKFRKMLDTLKSVQTELGGTLTEALQFVNESKQAGIFQQMDRAQFATQVRNVTQMTGMSRGDAMQLAAQGASISRQAGGVGAQGALGAMRMASTMGSALTAGAVSEAQLSEATGGLTGQSAIQAFTSNMMQNTSRFARRGMGRFSVFALANQEGGMDQGMLERFKAGDISVSEVGRRARGRVNQMGRAQAINREGELRGALMEEGGLSGQIGMMKLMLGDRVMNQGDDMSQLVMRRRFGMSRQEAGVMQGLMRNQGQIAMQESADRASGVRSSRREQLITTERSMDAVMRNVGHSLQEGLGLNEVRMMGRRFATKLSDRVERTMNEFLGIMDGEMSQATRGAAQRATMGIASQADMRRLDVMDMMAEGMGAGAFDPFRQGLLQQLGPGVSLGSQLEEMGYDIRGGGAKGRDRRGPGAEVAGDEMRRRTESAIQEIQMARLGIVGPKSQPAMRRMLADTGGTTSQLIEASLMARGMGMGEGGMFGILQQQGVDTTAAMGFMGQRGMTPIGGDLDMGRAVGPGRDRGGQLARDYGRMITRTAGFGSIYAGMRGIEELAGKEAGGIFGFLSEDLESLQATDRERATNWMMSGGRAARQARAESERLIEEQVDPSMRVGYAMRGGAAAERRRRLQNAAGGKTGKGISQPFMRAAAFAEGLQIKNQETLDALLDGTEMQSAIFKMGTGESAQEGLAEIKAMWGIEPDPERKQALASMVAQAENEIGEWGKVGDHWKSAALSTRAAEEAQAAYDTRMGTSRALGGVANRLAIMKGGEGFSDAMRLVASGMGESWAQGAEGMRGLVQTHAMASQGEQSAQMGMLSRIAGSAATPEQREEARRLMAMMAEGSNVQRGLMGEGRGGRRGGRRLALETAMGQFGGMGMGRGFSIEQKVGGRTRTLTGRRAQALLARQARGGDISGDVEEALRKQMTESGIMDDTKQTEMIDALESIGRATDEPTKAAAAERVKELRKEYGDDFRRVEREQMERQSQAARARDPLSAERNDLLKAIRDSPGVKAGPENGVTAAEEEAQASGVGR